MNKIILNASYDENVRSTVLTALQEIDRAETVKADAETKIAKADAEIKIVKADAEIKIANTDAEIKIVKADAEIKIANADAEKKIAKAEADRKIAEMAFEIQTITMQLEKSVVKESQYTARALIEYVENFVIPPNKPNQTITRRDKWTTFFTTDFRGQAAYSCIVRANPMWFTGEQKIAERLASAYQFQSDAHHATAYDIHSGIDFVVKRGAMTAQLYNMAECLNSALNLQGQFIA